MTSDASPVPTGAEIDEALRRSRLRRLPTPRGLARVLDVFGEDRSARAAGGQFALDMAPAARFHLDRNRLPETSFFRWFFSHAEVRSLFPDPADVVWPVEPPGPSMRGAGHALGMRLEGCWRSLAVVAALVAGGGIQRFAPPPDDRTSLRLTLGLARDAVQGLPTASSAYLSYEPWSDWFDCEGFDVTLFWLNPARDVATVLLITDGP